MPNRGEAAGKKRMWQNS